MVYINKRNHYFDNLKLFLIICVVLGNTFEYIEPENINYHYFLLILYMFHMPLFTFVSGYFSNKSKRKTKEKVIDTVKIYLAVQLFYYYFNYTFMQDHSTKFVLFYPYWTLWYFFSMICWYFISDYIKNKKKWLVFSIIFALYIGMDTSVGGYASISRTIVYLPYFIAGMMFKTEYIQKLKEEKWKLLGFSALILFALFMVKDNILVEYFFEFSGYESVGDNLSGVLVRLFHYSGSVIVIMTILAFIPKKEYSLSTIGSHSITIYIVHSAIMKIFYQNNVINYESLLNAIVSEITVVMTCILITSIYIKIKMNCTKKYRYIIKK